MSSGAWAMLKARADGQWDVTGGAVRRDFFFDGATKKEIIAYTDPTKWRIVYVPEGRVRVGVIVQLSDDGKTITWPAT